MNKAVRTHARVTVILPCYDDGRLLLDAIDSIEESEPVDVVVVDDCSTDSDTVDILGGLARDRARVIRHEVNRGPADARNTGLRACDTPYVFPLDADDVAAPGVLAAMADKLDADPGLAVCFGDYREFGSYELIRAVPSKLDAFRLAYVNEYPVTALFRREVLLAVGGWRPGGYEDWDLWLTLAERDYRGVHLGAGVVTYGRRLHGDRRLTAAKRTHQALYRRIRSDHPAVFRELRRHRQASDLPLHRKLLYPVVYGSRPRFGFERRLKRWLDRTGVWTLRR